MTTFLTAHNLSFIFGLLGNIISFFVFLSPIPTFYTIWKKKSAEGYQCLPYVVALFSAMLLMYYAFVKVGDAILLITINSFGIFIETIYITMYFYYATKKIKIKTMMTVVIMFCAYGVILASTLVFTKGAMRERVVGWACLIFSISVFVAPMFILKKVIKTRSVEFMPFSLSLSLTVNAVMWFFYGLLIKDMNIAVPNVLGFVFGLIQMTLYWMYKDGKKIVEDEIFAKDNKAGKQVVIEMNEDDKARIPDLAEQLIEIAKLKAMIAPNMIPLVPNPRENVVCGETLIVPQPNISIPVHA
ncbi:bidirectional sugar transporter NEC1-like [Impatiens glandulifera]|uniref:bidirectional sugar transporter NEC1-like n=1 Tax=Impatiens glandulifera TaxID=253017 RepID=UPI001FB09C5E|nr:bidirectional sugar transporter NEC1-like [Impatiens glandulifera]